MFIFPTRQNTLSLTQLAHSKPFIYIVFTLFMAESEDFIEGINQVLLCCFIRWSPFYCVGINSLWAHKTAWVSMWPLAMVVVVSVCPCLCVFIYLSPKAAPVTDKTDSIALEWRAEWRSELFLSIFHFIYPSIVAIICNWCLFYRFTICSE